MKATKSKSSRFGALSGVVVSKFAYIGVKNNALLILMLTIMKCSDSTHAQSYNLGGWSSAPSGMQRSQDESHLSFVPIDSVKYYGSFPATVLPFGRLMLHGASVVSADKATEPEAQSVLPVSYDKLEKREISRSTSYKASTYVTVEDSWIYPAFDRLAAMGYLPTSSAMLRPWTRLECARLLTEASLAIGNPDEETAPLLAALDREFRYETAVIDGDRNVSAKADNAYSRVTGIAGTPLRDGFHFAQSIVNDFGRPYGQGINSYDGLSGRAEYGPLAVYARAEYQYASTLPTYSAATQQYLTAHDVAPFGWNLRFGTTSRLRPLEVYASLNLRNWQFSFGQQSLWWGPGRSTSLILSNNAEALPMFRIARAKPIALPGFLGKVGPVHVDMFLVRQGGIHYVGLGSTFTLFGSPNRPLNPPPYLWGFAFSINPSNYLEIGFAHTVIFAGYGRPLTLGTFFHTFSVDGNGQAIDPGKRITEFNFAYHPPFLRKKLVLYTEAMAWDNPIQGKFVARYAFSPGIYVPRIPKLPKLDLRLEGVYTDLPKLPYQGYFYNNARYVQGYTNYGQILGSWVGPQGIGGEGSSTYWFSPRSKAGVSYRKMVSDTGYFQGGNRSDLAAKFSWTPSTSIEVSGTAQYGRWKFPVISSDSKSDFTTTFQIRFFPKTHQGL